jgi:hypothetical protein
MSATPSVFRPVRFNDVHVRPFKAYKQYFVTSVTSSGCNLADTGSGYYARSAVHNTNNIPVDAPSYEFLLNDDSSNQNIEWRSLDHRFYRYPYDWARSSELTNITKNYKFLFYSASTIAIPYLEAGERIKPGSVTVSSSLENQQIVLRDDFNGNLRDPLILTSSFASSSYLRMYYSFNDTFRKFNSNFGLITSGSITFQRQKTNVDSIVRNVEIQPGVTLVNNNTNVHNSGLSGYFNGSSYIRLANNDIYNRFNHCDRWSISFWINPDSASLNSTTTPGVVLSKGAVVRQLQPIPNGNNTGTVMGYADTILNRPNQLTEAWVSHKTPFEICVGTPLTSFYVSSGYVSASYVETLGVKPSLKFITSDGNSSTEIYAGISGSQWQHYAIVYDGDNITILRNGVFEAAQPMPKYATVNAADIIIGATDTAYRYGFKGNLAELRFYDYALNGTAIQSLANRHFLSGSLYQTNVAGNVFYRNEQVVITSPMPKYNSGSGFFKGDWSLRYRGQRTIYENEVMVRIPADVMNVSTNPSATFRMGSGQDNNCNTAGSGNGAERYNEPGEYRLTGFLSGSIYPYITTIGLYNNKGQLLAVGKLAQAVQKRDDIPTNIILRWDY